VESSSKEISKSIIDKKFAKPESIVSPRIQRIGSIVTAYSIWHPLDVLSVSVCVFNLAPAKPCFARVS
jgi:hypothetical protein